MIYDFSTLGENNLVNFDPLRKKSTRPLTYDLKIQQGSRGCQVHVCTKYHQPECSGS